MGMESHEDPRTVLIPLPDKDFDPTECAVPWKLLSLNGMLCVSKYRFMNASGHKVVFATEKGNVPQADPLLLNPAGYVRICIVLSDHYSVVFGKLGAEFEPRMFYDGTN